MKAEQFVILLKVNKRIQFISYLALITVLLGICASILFLMGRIPICACGEIKFWFGALASSENSQHLTDWYTFSHVIHGIVFYGMLWFFRKKLSIGKRFILAVVVEILWELVENTPMVIDRYRTATIALDYYGDSIVNSLADVLAMMLGFLMALKLPVWVLIVMILLMELIIGYLIRDNLTLNVIMLLYPMDAIRVWQGGI